MLTRREVPRGAGARDPAEPALTSLSMSRSGYLMSGLSRVIAGVERWNSFMSRL